MVVGVTDGGVWLSLCGSLSDLAAAAGKIDFKLHSDSILSLFLFSFGHVHVFMRLVLVEGFHRVEHEVSIGNVWSFLYGVTLNRFVV